MQEAKKTNLVRGQAFIETYFTGNVIDIGAGNSLVVPDAEPFDIEHGDANRIDEQREAGAYDCVHSSHALEHMDNPADALGRWWRLVRPGGYLVVVVPEEDLYEQGNWPSIFSDPRSSFRLDRQTTWSPVSHDIRALVLGLISVEIISAEVQGDAYDHDLKRLVPENEEGRRLRERQRQLLMDLGAKKLLSMALLDELNRLFFDLGASVDQTTGSALAQSRSSREKPRIDGGGGDRPLLRTSRHLAPEHTEI
ncbi:MAG: methyltransferase domain-containing protein [Alphaproteobacteria bacterium]|nr:methyltransferase domain-containing protein [Alphaproteobacteria bacterium]